MSLIFAMILYSFSMSVTPGPVNIVTFSSAVNFGFRKAIFFVSGATIGFSALLLSIGLGLSYVLTSYPFILQALTYFGCLFTLYLGYKIMTSEGNLSDSRSQPPKFLSGWALQWLNPKAWLACIAGVSAFNLIDNYWLLLQFVTIYLVFCFLGISFWAFLGSQLKQRLVSPSQLKRLNQLMGFVLIAIAIYLLFRQIHQNIGVISPAYALIY